MHKFYVCNTVGTAKILLRVCGMGEHFVYLVLLIAQQNRTRRS